MSLCSDSRRATPGCLFIAVSGMCDDGARHIREAVEKGASVIVTERAVEVGSLPRRVPVLQVRDVRTAKAELARQFFADVSRRLVCVGITGTNGKTTTSTMVHSILEAEGWRPALVGTIEQRLPGGERREASHTTPDLLDLYDLLVETDRRGGRAVVMEVSSHALVQARTQGIRFQAAAFTHLTPEHLDYHGTMEAYRDAKARLFEDLESEATAVLNRDDPVSACFAARTRARVVHYGFQRDADYWPEIGRVDVSGFKAAIHAPGGVFEVECPLLARHNVANALAAIATTSSLGVERNSIQRGLNLLGSIPGRLESIHRGQDFEVLIDYAHTDDALEKVLDALRPLTRGRLLLVFGCGGDRDRSKRPRMGRVASLKADSVWITNDNPRSEPPEAIAAEILEGVVDRSKVEVLLDRRDAIAAALSRAAPGDIVLIAGKGHESEQVVGAMRRPFHDRSVAEELLCRPAP